MTTHLTPSEVHEAICDDVVALSDALDRGQVTSDLDRFCLLSGDGSELSQAARDRVFAVVAAAGPDPGPVRCSERMTFGVGVGYLAKLESMRRMLDDLSPLRERLRTMPLRVAGLRQVRVTAIAYDYDSIPGAIVATYTIDVEYHVDTLGG